MTNSVTENQRFNDLVNKRMNDPIDGLLIPVGHTTIIHEDMMNKQFKNITLYENL